MVCSFKYYYSISFTRLYVLVHKRKKTDLPLDVRLRKYFSWYKQNLVRHKNFVHANPQTRSRFNNCSICGLRKLLWEWPGFEINEKIHAHSHCCHASVERISTLQIWANVQKYDDPPRVNLDVGGSGWRPFFGRGGLRDPGLASVQPPRLTLPLPDPAEVKALQERLELSLRDAFMKWRGTNR